MQSPKVHIFLTIFTCAKKKKRTEFKKNKDSKCPVITDFILPDDDELIRRPIAY